MWKLILILTLGFFVYGDVMYEMSATTEGMMGMGGGETSMSVYVKGDCSRTETTSKSPMAGEITTITITRLDKKVIWTLDDDKKQYSEINIGEAMQPEEVEEKDETVIPEIKIEKTGKKKEILGKTCEEVIVSMDIKSQEGTFTLTQVMWVAKGIAAYKEIEDFNKKLTELRSDLSSSPMMGIDKESFNEFQKKISEIEGFPLEFDMTITMGTEEMSFSTKTHYTITKIETKPINQKVFEIPEGYVPIEQ